MPEKNGTTIRSNRFGAFEGVFTPTLLSILGVIMYLRLGWVVGEVGLKNALVIVIAANLITLFTGLAAASITTNIRVGTGGAYSMISKSLGYEVGGAIGIPLYLSQAISVAFYITGFTECWVSVFPQHNLLFVSVITWVALLMISYSSTKLAFRLQYVIMAIIALSIISAFLGKARIEQAVFAWHGVGEVPFWRVFAIYFPAVTGILAGISMSGELKNPERDIPVGTLSAIVIGFLVYLSMTFWYARVASPQELVANRSIIIDISRWRFLVIAGIMGATLSSALSMLVASPRTLLALSKHRIIPFSHSFSHINIKGEPTTAILLTALISLITLTLGTLDAVAGVLTMVFLVTYGMLNISVFIEKSIGIVSFRPAFRIPLIFSFLGGVGCFWAMFLINPLFGIISIVIICGIYFLLLRKEIERNWPDVRKGLFIFIAEQAVKIASKLPYHPKIWKPNLVVPIVQPVKWLEVTELLKSIVSPSGRIDIFAVTEPRSETSPEAISEQAHDKAETGRLIEKDIKNICDSLREENIFVSSHIIESKDIISASKIALQTLKSGAFPPNILLMQLGATDEEDMLVRSLVDSVSPQEMGIMLFDLQPQTGLGSMKTINLWIRQGSPNRDLAILTALNLQRNCDATIRLVQAVEDEEARLRLQEYLEHLKKITRMPGETEIVVLVGKFDEIVKKSPSADLNIFGMSEEMNFTHKRQIATSIDTSVLFLRDSQQESAIV
ncbi:MAG: Na-K-Cl cotransporter [Candidatus Omnitrophica bacterium]|nr:Na-K-Cl cotransporter [Candidatus Omnitrophota bacterium]MBU1868847.1 Na-K-Cl cotransporter [Candidatus Omnitrophota bacterium]